MKMLLPSTHYVDIWLDQIDAQTMVRQTHAARYKNLLYTLKEPKELLRLTPLEWPEHLTNVASLQSAVYFSSHSFAALWHDAVRIKPDVLEYYTVDDQSQSIVQSLIEAVVQQHVLIYIHNSEIHTISLQKLFALNAMCQKVTVIIAPYAQATILDDRVWNQTHAIESVEIVLQNNARLTWLNNADQANLKNFVARTQCVLEEQAHLSYGNASKPARYSYHEWYVDLKGVQSTVEHSGMYVLTEDQNYTLRTYQHHNGRDTKSTVAVKGLLHGNAYFDYSGMITIAKTAAGTHAHQENKNMLFSSLAVARSEPSLQVLTNDVQCSHGSATGYFDPEQILYAQTRGIELKEIYSMLTNAFCSDMIALFDTTHQDDFYKFVQESVLGEKVI